MKKLLLLSTIAALGLTSCSKSDNDNTPDYSTEITGHYEGTLEYADISKISKNKVNMVVVVTPLYGSSTEVDFDSLDVTIYNHVYMLGNDQITVAQISGNTLTILGSSDEQMTKQ